MSGWIKLHRGLIDWEWYDDINTSRLFIHCLLKANHKDKKWRGLDINRGEFWTSLDTLSDETGLSKKCVRTSLERLKGTGELADKGHSTGRLRGRMITVVKYDSYQDEGTQTARETADKGQAKGTQGADKGQPLKNDKKEKNNKNKDIEYSEWPYEASPEVLKAWLTKRKQVKASLSQLAMNTVGKQLHIAASNGFTVDQCLCEAEAAGWKGFKAAWMANKQSTGYQTANEKAAARSAQTQKMDSPQDLEF